jgi:hypothetical protein
MIADSELFLCPQLLLLSGIQSQSLRSHTNHSDPLPTTGIFHVLSTRDYPGTWNQANNHTVLLLV